MSSRYKFTEADIECIKNARKENKNKRVEARLKALELRAIGEKSKEIRKRGFKNEIFDSLDKVIERLCETICSLSTNTVKSITGRDRIIKCFN